MKNVSISIQPNYLAPPPMPTSPPPQFPIPATTPAARYSATFNMGAQFDSEDEALSFASFLIGKIEEYKNKDCEGMTLGDLIKKDAR